MTRRQLLALLASLPLVRFLPDISTIARAADAKEKVVAVTKTDGTVLRGKVVSYDRDKLTLEITDKPKDPPTKVEIPWDQIKRVSNGLTREKGLQKWKAENHDKLCEMCHGDGKMFCPTCHGTAHDPAAGKDCPTCKGAGQIACKTPKCDHGTVPCPNSKCLKLTDPGWYKKADGTRWKKFAWHGGYKEWSDHHCGQVIEIVNGEPTEAGKCPVCGGTTTISDPVCRGTGNIPCPTCVRRTEAPPCPDKCEGGLVQCPTCKGSGLKVAT